MIGAHLGCVCRWQVQTTSTRPPPDIASMLDRDRPDRTGYTASPLHPILTFSQSEAIRLGVVGGAFGSNEDMRREAV